MIFSFRSATRRGCYSLHGGQGSKHRMYGEGFKNPDHSTARNWVSQEIWARKNSRVSPTLVNLPGQDKVYTMTFLADVWEDFHWWTLHDSPEKVH